MWDPSQRGTFFNARVVKLFVQHLMDRTDISKFERDSFKAKCNPAPISRDEIHLNELNQDIHCEIVYPELQDTELQEFKKEEICKSKTKLIIFKKLHNLIINKKLPLSSTKP